MPTLQIDFAGACQNNCMSCISRQHVRYIYYPVSVIEWYKKLKELTSKFHTGVISGWGEPFYRLEENPYLPAIREVMAEVPFKALEVQTSGLDVTASRLNRFKRAGVTRVALSLFSVHSELDNLFKGAHNYEWNIGKTADLIIRMGFSLRIVYLLSAEFAGYNQNDLINHARMLGADQATLKVLQISETAVNTRSGYVEWVEQNMLDSWSYERLVSSEELKEPVTRLMEFDKPPRLFSLRIDPSCQTGTTLDAWGDLRYQIFRKDGNLYSAWEDFPKVQKEI